MGALQLRKRGFVSYTKIAPYALLSQPRHGLECCCTAHMSGAGDKGQSAATTSKHRKCR